MATTGTRSIKTNYRLSPNEEAALIKQEKEKRRKLRIQQVREQERNFASKIRTNVNKKKEEELHNLAVHLKQNWQRERKERTDVLQRVYERSLSSVGDGHRAASVQPPLTEINTAKSIKDQHAARQRYSTALKKHQENKEEQYEKEHATILARKSAFEIEKARAAKIASLPPPIKDPIDELDDIGKENQVVTVISGFSTSHYHLKGEYVEKAEPYEQEDARLAAQEESRRAKEENENAAREEKERQEKARLRHQHARKQELLHQDYNKLMKELGHLEQADRRRRQAIVANIPHQVFQPPHKRLEDKQDAQQKLEQAFEDMYMANTDYTGDLILALEPKPREDADLDVTMDSVADDVGITLQPLQQEIDDNAGMRFDEDVGLRFPRGIDDEDEEEERTVMEEKPRQPEAPLKLLMDRIKSQREELKKKKKLVLEIPSQDALQGEESESPQSSRGLPGPSSPSIEGSQATSESERSTVDTLETGTISEDTNKQDEKISTEDGWDMMLLHPMEKAAKIRATIKMPDVELQKRAQYEIMAKEDEQRLRLTEQQLQDHIKHRDHLQLLQDNLLQRQKMLQQQIEQQERQHQEQLQLQQQEHVQQQAAMWTKELQQKQELVKQQIDQEKQRREQLQLQQQEHVQKQAAWWKKELQQKQEMVKRQIEQDKQRREQKQQQVAQQQTSQEQYQMDSRQRLHNTLQLQQHQPSYHRPQLAQQQQVFDQQQHSTQYQQQPDQQHDQYHELPEKLHQQQSIAQQQHTQQHLLQQQQHLLQQQQQQLPSTSKEPSVSNGVEGEGTKSSDPPKPINEFINLSNVQGKHSKQAEKVPTLPESHTQPESYPISPPEGLASTHYPIPITVHQGHSMEWKRLYGPDTLKTSTQHLPYRDQGGIQLPRHDTLQEAQRSLQQRRARLMQQYPELKLPPYEPYIRDNVFPTSTAPTAPTANTLTDASLRQDAPTLDKSPATLDAGVSIVRTDASMIRTGAPTIDTWTGIPITNGIHGAARTISVSSMWTGAPTTGTDVTPTTGVSTSLWTGAPTAGTGVTPTTGVSTSLWTGAPTTGTGVTPTTGVSTSLWTGFPITGTYVGMAAGVSTSRTGVMTTGVSTMKTGVSPEGTDTYSSRLDVGVLSGAGTSRSPQSGRYLPGGSPLSQMERQLEQHRQILLKTRQQLQQEQQQQQRRILEKQTVLAQRIEQQRQEQLTRMYTQDLMSQSLSQDMMSQSLPQDVMMSHAWTQGIMTPGVMTSGVMTSQLLPQDVMMSHARTQGIMTPGVMTSQSLPQDVMMSHAEVMTSYSHTQPLMTVESEGHEDQETTISEIESQGPLNHSEPISSECDTEQTSVRDTTEPSPAAYKLPSISFGQTSYQYKPPHGLDVKSPQSTDEPPLFHELSPESSSNRSASSDQQSAEFSHIPHDESIGTIERGFSRGIQLLSQPIQYEWKTVLASNSALHRPSEPTQSIQSNPAIQSNQPIQSALQSVRLPKHPRPPSAPLRLPWTLEEAAPHELSTIIEVESPGGDRIPRSYPSLIASTPHKSSPSQSGYNHRDVDVKTYPFFLGDHPHLSTEASGKASKKAFTTDELSRKGHPQVDMPISASIPGFAVDVGQGILSYPASSIIPSGILAPLPKAPTVSMPPPFTVPSAITSPAIIEIASPATNNEGASPKADSQYSSSVSPLSEHTLRQTQNSLSSSLLSEGSIERFLALSASEGTTSDSVPSMSARYLPQIPGSDRRSSKSPIIKDFVMDIPSGSWWQDTETVLPSLSLGQMGPVEPNISIYAAMPRPSTTLNEYSLCPVSPQSTWTDMDTHSGSYLNNEVPAMPVYRQGIPNNGMPMFSDVSLSYCNTSLESGQGVPFAATIGPGVLPQNNQRSTLTDGESVGGFHSSVSPRGETEQWFMPQQSLDVSGFQQLTGGGTLQQRPDRVESRQTLETGDSRLELNPIEEEEDDGKDADSSKLSHAGTLTEESHNTLESMDDTLQEAMRNVALSESETSKEMGIIEEPDLTLISLNTTMTSSVAPDDDNKEEEKPNQWKSEDLGSDSLLSFLHHEGEMSLDSPARTGSDRSGADETSSSVEKDQVILTTDTSQDNSISLQEAFARHKQAFINSCQSRQGEVKVRAVNQQATAFSQTLDNWKKSRGGKVQRSTKPRTASSPSKGHGVKGKRSAVRRSTQETNGSSNPTAQTKEVVYKTVTASDRKVAEKEMYKRNVRLYNQLEEVQKHKITQQRQKDYATNRQRRKDFEQKLQSRLNKLTKITKPSS